MSDTTVTSNDSTERPAEFPASAICARCLANLGGVRLDGACPKCGLLTVMSVPPPVRSLILRKQGLRHAPDGLLCQRCGHSLGGLTLKDVCPECELSVATSIEGGGWQAALTDDGAVVADTPCTRCVYNLRGLHESGDCPECGLPVRRTIVGNFICFADPVWARQIARGARLLSCFVRLLVVLPVTLILMSFLVDLLPFDKNDLLPWSIALSLPLVIGLGCFGLLLITASEHTWKSSDRSARHRRTARLGLIGGIVTIAVVRVAAWTPGAVSGLQVLGIALPLASLAIGLIGYFGYVGMLCARIPNARLSRVSGWLRVGFGYSMVILTGCLVSMVFVRFALPQWAARPIYGLGGIVVLIAGGSAIGSALRAIFFHSRLAAALANEADLANKNISAAGDT